MALIEGQFHGKLIQGTAKVGKRKDKMLAFAELEVVDGEHKGKRFPYEGQLDARGIKYTKRDLIALGWKGVTAASVTADCDAALAAGLVVPFEVEIATWNKPANMGGGVKQWSTIRSIGRAAPKIDPIDKDKIADVDQWFKEAGDVGAASADEDQIPF